MTKKEKIRAYIETTGFLTTNGTLALLIATMSDLITDWVVISMLGLLLLGVLLKFISISLIEEEK